MSYKAAFFDIDWTLYDHKNHRWDHKSVEAVSHLKEKGIECFLCSARPLDSMTDLGVFQLGIDWRGYVASAGAVTVMDGKTLKAFMMKEADVVNFVRLVHYLHVSAEIVYPEECFFFGDDTPFSESYYKEFNEKQKRLGNAGRMRTSDAVGFNLFISTDYDPLFAKEFPGLVFRRYAPFGVDVMPCVREKSSGIEAVIERLGISKEEVISFGDGIQDIPMARVSHFVALGNAGDEVKAAASEVTSPVWESGVYEALKKHGLAE